ncbi:hypothetical protein MMC28_006415 [Mycoblastus sanguinarius]|nr:hypothetical protein [Mycoblastus sanguinarius]
MNPATLTEQQQPFPPQTQSAILIEISPPIFRQASGPEPQSGHETLFGSPRSHQGTGPQFDQTTQTWSPEFGRIIGPQSQSGRETQVESPSLLQDFGLQPQLGLYAEAGFPSSQGYFGPYLSSAPYPLSAGSFSHPSFVHHVQAGSPTHFGTVDTHPPFDSRQRLGPEMQNGLPISPIHYDSQHPSFHYAPPGILDSLNSRGPQFYTRSSQAPDTTPTIDIETHTSLIRQQTQNLPTWLTMPSPDHPPSLHNSSPLGHDRLAGISTPRKRVDRPPFDLNKAPYGAFRDVSFAKMQMGIEDKLVCRLVKIRNRKVLSMQSIRTSDINDMVDIWKNHRHVRVAAPWPAIGEPTMIMGERIIDDLGADSGARWHQR